MIINTPYGEITIPFYNGDIAVSSSGGADSTILLYILSLNPLNQPRALFIENANSKLEAAINCVNYINEKSGTAIIVEPQSRISTGHELAVEIHANGNKTGYIYTGVTKNPPVIVSETGIPTRLQNLHTHIITPFYTVDKRATIWLYKYFKVEDLLDLTYTCTESTPPCQLCFACKERNWAINEVENDSH